MKNNFKRLTAAAMAITLMGTGTAISNAIIPNDCSSITAHAAQNNEIGVLWEDLTETVTTSDGVIITPSNNEYFKVSFTIKNNTGCTIFFFFFPYDSSKLEVIKNAANGKPAYTCGEVWDKEVENTKKAEISWRVTLNEGIEDRFKDEKKDKGLSGLISIASIGLDKKEKTTKDGVVMTYYLKSKRNPKTGKLYTDETPCSELIASPTMDKVLDGQTNNIEHSTPSEIKVVSNTKPKNDKTIKTVTYIIGDVNKDTKIDLVDAQLFCNKYGIKGNSKLSVKVNSSYDKVFDVNGDGYIKAEDAEYILDYYLCGSVCGISSKAKYKIGDKFSEYIIVSK